MKKMSRLGAPGDQLRWRPSLKPKDDKRIKDTYEIPDDVVIRILDLDESIEGSGLENKVCIFEMMLKVNVSLLLPFVIRKILYSLDLSPIQIKPNGWCNVLGYSITWPMVLGRNAQLTVPEFLNLFWPIKYNNAWTLQARDKKFLTTPPS